MLASGRYCRETHLYGKRVIQSRSYEEGIEVVDATSESEKELSGVTLAGSLEGTP